MIARIVDHTHESEDVQSLARVSRATRLFANMRIWEFCDTEKLEELTTYPPLEQQQFVNVIRGLEWDIISAMGTNHWNFTHLQFRVRSVHIRHYDGIFSLVRMNQFFQPALKQLVITEFDRGANQVSTNFIPLLANCPQLQTLWIAIDTKATDAEFLNAVTACRRLESFLLRGPVCRVFKSQMFQYLATQSVIKELHYRADGLRFTQNLIGPTVAALAPGQTIFNHLTSLHTGIAGAVAKALFPRMPTIKKLSLYIDKDDDVVDSLRLLPQLENLSLVARAENLLLTPHSLRGLQNLHLTTLAIKGDRDFEFNGLMITIPDIDTVFGSQATLRFLKVGWQGDQDNDSFLQFSPVFLMERVLLNYRVLETLEMSAPCGAVNLKSLPLLPTNSNIRVLEVEAILPPQADPDVRPTL